MERDLKVAASEGAAESCRCGGARTRRRCPLINQGLSWNSFEVNLDIRPNVNRGGGFCIALWPPVFSHSVSLYLFPGVGARQRVGDESGG